MDGQSLDRRYRALRRRVWLIFGSAAAGWAVVVACLLALVVAWFDLLWELSPPVRVACDALLLVVPIVALGIGCRRVLSRTLRPVLARRLDRAAGSGGQILTGFELSSEAGRRPDEPPLTRGLAALAVARAALIAEGVPAHQVVTLAALRRATLGLTAVAVTFAGLALFCPDLTGTQSLRFLDPFGDHPPYSRVVFHVKPGDVKVLYGGGLDVLVATEGPAPGRVELVLCGATGHDEVLPMFQGREGQWRTVLTRVTSEARYYARARRSRSRQFQIDVITVPTLVAVKCRVAQPEYAHRAVYQGAMPKGSIAGLAGTRVQVWAESNRPLDHGALSMASPGTGPDVRLEPVAGSPEIVTGTFEIHAPGQFAIGVTDVAGHDSPEKFAGSIVVLPDEKPFVRVLQPPAVAFATPDATLPLIASAEDDCGLSAMQLFRSLNDSRAMPMDLALPQPAPVRFDGQQGLPLSAYGLQPGDVIKLFVRVEDNDPVRAKGAESALVSVQIISQEDFQRMQRRREGLEALVSKYRQAERRLESLATDNEALRKGLEAADDEQLTDEDREALGDLADRLREEAVEIRKAAENLLPFDLDPALVGRLTELADSLEESAEALAPSAERAPDRAAALGQLAELKKQLGQEQDQFDQQAMQPLEHLEKIFPLIEDQARFTHLYERQRDLAERLASLKGLDENNTSQVKARMRNLEEEQNRLREEMNALLDDIETHAKRLPDDERLNELRSTALDFADALRASGASESMIECEIALVTFSGTDGHAGAEKAADILEQFLGKCSGMGEQGRTCLKFQPSLEQGLGNTVDQLLAEMGLGGQGQGSGGYSMQRSSLGNVGLFGNLPLTEQRSGSGSLNGAAGQGAGYGPAGPRDHASIVTGENRGTAAGTAAESVPPRYRSRVGAYFQRIAEETPAE